MSEELRLCPFCGEMPIGQDDRYMCSTLGCVMQENTISAKDWNTRPIEDALTARIAELEAEIDQLTAHSDIERQDDKSPNDTQSSTIVYGKEDSEVQESEATSCKFCGSNKSDRRMNSIVCSGCGRKIGNVAPPEVQE